MGDFVEIFEVGPRDGLQNEKRQIPTVDKIALVDLLSTAGFRRIEAVSFVSPKWVPQMADGADVMSGITRRPGVSYAGLTPNTRGLDRAIEAGVDEVSIFGAASEGFSKANLNRSIDESLALFLPVMEAAKAVGLPVRGYVSCVVECPYEGVVSPGAAAQVAKSLFEMGCFEISLGDTIGRGTPEAIDAMLKAVLDVVPADQLAGHYHDTGGRALDNIEVSLNYGVRVFDAAVGGLGGCPYAPGAAGNVATELVAKRLHTLGFETGLDLGVIDAAAQMAKSMRSVP